MARKARPSHTPQAARQSDGIPDEVRQALLEIRRGILMELRASELEDEARAMRRRGRLRQIRAIEALVGAQPIDAAPRTPEE